MNNQVRRGRPRGSVKDPNRPKIRDEYNRLIDVNGPKYMRLIQNGYIHSEDNTRLIVDSNFTGERFIRRTRGRPRTNPVVDNTLRVINPRTNRQIVVNGATFRNVVKQGYEYNEARNTLTKYVPHPKNKV